MYKISPPSQKTNFCEMLHITDIHFFTKESPLIIFTHKNSLFLNIFKILNNIQPYAPKCEQEEVKKCHGSLNHRLQLHFFKTTP
jgi:hypothetical protein